MRIGVNYVVEAGRVFHFRYTVPQDVRPYVGRTEIKRSLGTDNWREAVERAEQVTWRTLELIRSIRKHMAEADENVDRDELITEIVRRAFEDVLAADEMRRMHQKRLTEEERAEEVRRLEAALALERSALARNDLTTIWDHVIHFVTQYEYEEYFDDPGDLRKLSRDTLKAYITNLEIMLERAKGNYDNPYGGFSTALIESSRTRNRTEGRPVGTQKAPGTGPASVQNVGVASVGPTSKFRGLGELVGEYIEERSSSNEWDPKTTVTVRAVLDDLTEILGENTDLACVTRKQLVALRQTLQQLPPNRKKLARYRDKTFRQILAMPNVKAMALETLRKRMTWVSTFLKWCVQQDYMPKNPAEGLIPKRREGDSSEARDPFSHDELTALVAALAAHEMESDNRHERFWCPLIALYSGMR